jgi:cation diffusion facilitator family transporter
VPESYQQFMEVTVMERSNQQIAIRVSTHTIIGNVVLFIFKLIAGIIGNSAAMISDAVHSLSDVLSTMIVIIGVKLANKQADKDHPYGHERFECVAALILAAILCATGIAIGYGGVRTIIAGHYETLPIPGLVALIAAIVSIAIKEAMYWYTRAAAKKINSSVLMADAWHHRSDSLSSIGSFVGILGSRIGFPILDSVACIVICTFILKVALTIFMDAIGKMTDRACDDETIASVTSLILSLDGVHGIDLLKTRVFGDKIYIDVEICVDGNATLHDSHQIAHAVHDAIEAEFPNVKHCMVHVNPMN